MGAHAAEENPDLPRRAAESVALAKKLKMETGRWPAVLLLTSHGDTAGPFAWLRFEMLRQGLQIAQALTQAEWPGLFFRPAPECLLAIDPYALDTVPAAVGGFYSGWMRRVYLAWDRQPSTQSRIQRHFLLQGTGYDRIAWRLLETLRSGVPVLMVLAGGLPHNARLLYGAREFMQRLRLPRWPYPKRAAEKKMMEILMRPVGGIRPAENGDLPPAAEEALDRLFAELGIGPAERPALLGRFKQEFRLAIPRRERLARVLARRLALKGQPLLLLNIRHRTDASPHVQLGEPWGWAAAGSGQLSRITLAASKLLSVDASLPEFFSS